MKDQIEVMQNEKINKRENILESKKEVLPISDKFEISEGIDEGNVNLNNN